MQGKTEYLSDDDWGFILSALRERARTMEAASKQCYRSGTARGARRVPRNPDGLVANYDTLGVLLIEQSEQAESLAARIANAREAGTPIDTASD